MLRLVGASSRRVKYLGKSCGAIPHRGGRPVLFRPAVFAGEDTARRGSLSGMAVGHRVAARSVLDRETGQGSRGMAREGAPATEPAPEGPKNRGRTESAPLHPHSNTSRNRSFVLIPPERLASQRQTLASSGSPDIAASGVARHNLSGSLVRRLKPRGQIRAGGCGSATRVRSGDEPDPEFIRPRQPFLSGGTRGILATREN